MYTFPALSLAAGCSIAHKLQKGPPDCNESTCEEGYRRVMCAPAIGGNTEIGRRVGVRRRLLYDNMCAIALGCGAQAPGEWSVLVS